MTEKKIGKATALVEGGRRKEWRRRLVNVPVERASTILFDSVEELHGSKPGLGSYRYGLQGTATHWSLTEALTALEPSAAGTALYPTGLAAITTPLLTLLSPGDELLAPDTVYGPTRRFCDTILKRLAIATRYYDPLVGRGIGELIGEHTRAILLESPGSLTMEVQDVPGICAVARERGVVTLLDNTWATPLLFPAIAAGVDVTILAATKYVGATPTSCSARPRPRLSIMSASRPQRGTSARPYRPTMPGWAREGYGRWPCASSATGK